MSESHTLSEQEWQPAVIYVPADEPAHVHPGGEVALGLLAMDGKRLRVQKVDYSMSDWNCNPDFIVQIHPDDEPDHCLHYLCNHRILTD